MKLNNLFSRSKTVRSKNAASSIIQHDLDKKLVQSIQPRHFPNWSQLKYLKRFLDQREKKIIFIAFFASILTAVSWFGFELATHLKFVPKDGGTYSEALIGQPKYINPLFSSINDVDSDLTKLVYAGLFNYSQDQKLTPELAEKYTVSADQKIYTISLKNSLRWSDGEPITADDVMYTFEMIQSQETGSPLYISFQGIQLEKIDSKTIRFTLKEPFAPFLHSLTVGILPEHTWAPSSQINPANIKLAKTNLQPIGSGPWKFDRLIKKDDGSIQSFELVRNENYFKKKPFIKKLTFTFFEDCSQAFQEVQSKHILGTSFVSCKSKEEMQKKNLSHYPIKLPQYTALFFNQADFTILKDDDLRLSLSKGTNKADLVSTVLKNEGDVINSPITEGSLGYYPEIKKINYNTDEANSLLDKKWTRIQPEEYFKIRYDALLKTIPKTNTNTTTTSTQPIVDPGTPTIEDGLETKVRKEMEASQTFYRKNKQNEVLQLTITTIDTPEYEQAAQFIAKNWQLLGIQTNINLIRTNDIRRDILRNHNYAILLYGEVVGADPDLFAFWHSSQVDYPGLNLAQFSNRDADKLLEDARKTTDEAERNNLYKKFQDILITELPAIFLYSPIYDYVINNQVKGVNIPRIVSPADRFNSLPYWYLKTKWEWR